VTAERTVSSASWPGPAPELSVIISTHRRPAFLPGLLSALEVQDCVEGRFEVVLVDDGSADGPAGTWDRIVELVGASSARVLAVERAASGGPAAGRNDGVGRARGDVFAFTDDDCLPQPAWVRELLDAFAEGADLVQGRTSPDPSSAGGAGPWARTIAIDGPTPLFETCNIAYRRSWFERLGGFDEQDSLTAPGAGSHFGEDTVLGGRLVAAGGRAEFRSTAVVHHRWLPGSFSDHLRHQRRLAGFPGLAVRSDALVERLWLGVFLSKRTAAFDLAVVGAVLAARRGRAWPLALALPWARARWPEATAKRAGRPALVRLGQLAVSDLVGLASLVQGTVRHRRPIL
jgi:GT2 family glycosyltransferase